MIKFVKLVGFVWLALILPVLAAEKIAAEKLGAPKAETAQQTPAEKPMPLVQQTQLLCEAHRIMASYADPSYKAGVDAYGRPVAPADVAAPQEMYTVPEEIQIPVTINFAKHLSLPVLPEMKKDVAMITVRRDGRLLYNGKDTTSQLQALCNETTIEPENKIFGGKVQ